tara:strand:+ start:1790 stop:2203 length:414 start_codon:yes stop_codon:yes gene_type:complete
MEINNEEFMTVPVLRIILKQFGWDYSDMLMDYCTEGDRWQESVVPLRADFYPVGATLARTKKGFIICDGYKTNIKYKNESFLSPWGIYERFGIKGFEDMKNWRYEEEKEWVIKKFNGEWVQSFTKLTELPYRTKVRC